MKFLVIIWAMIMGLLCIFGTVHADDTDKDGNYKINWRMLLLLVMFPLTPIVAHFCDLI